MPRAFLRFPLSRVYIYLYSRYKSLNDYSEDFSHALFVKACWVRLHPSTIPQAMLYSAILSRPGLSSRMPNSFSVRGMPGARIMASMRLRDPPLFLPPSLPHDVYLLLRLRYCAKRLYVVIESLDPMIKHALFSPVIDSFAPGITRTKHASTALRTNIHLRLLLSFVAPENREYSLPSREVWMQTTVITGKSCHGARKRHRRIESLARQVSRTS
ncbi:hypothetical protein F4823DRAFT_417891 [Ustulina deusta]|nr:hypothetical protein F4823DRAFT_417891 [Ustulina deusta]